MSDGAVGFGMFIGGALVIGLAVLMSIVLEIDRKDQCQKIRAALDLTQRTEAMNVLDRAGVCPQ